MCRNRLMMLLLLITGMLGYAPHALSSMQSLPSIVLQAEAFLEAYPYQTPYPARFTFTALDKRLKLKACDKALNVQFTRVDKVFGNTSLSVNCETPVRWQIHLPVRVDLFDDVLVNKIPLLKGQTIDARDLRYRKENVSRLQSGFYRKGDSMDQLQVKRNIAANSILNSSHLTQKQLVRSGQQVTIILNFKGLQVKSTGKALQSASRGQIIKVRNSQTNKIVEGIVSAQGQITVQL